MIRGKLNSRVFDNRRALQRNPSYVISRLLYSLYRRLVFRSETTCLQSEVMLYPVIIVNVSLLFSVEKRVATRAAHSDSGFPRFGSLERRFREDSDEEPENPAFGRSGAGLGRGFRR